MINIKLKNFNIRLDYLLLPAFFLTLLTNTFEQYLLSYIFITIHEVSHIITAICFKANLTTVTLMPVGISAGLNGLSLKKSKRVFIYMAGPLANIALAGLILILNVNYTFISNQWINLNLCLGIFNLIPILPFDGGKILRELFSKRFGMLTAGRYTCYISVLLLIGISISTLCGVYFGLSQFVILALVCYVVFLLKCEGMEAALMNMMDFIYRKNRLLKKGIYPAREMVAIKTITLSECLKYFDYDRFHIVHVLDEELKVIATYTEQQILDLSVKLGAETTFEHLQKIYAK